MANCIYCGEETILYANNEPVCLICDSLPPGERLKRKEAKQKRESAERDSRTNGQTVNGPPPGTQPTND